MDVIPEGFASSEHTGNAGNQSHRARPTFLSSTLVSFNFRVFDELQGAQRERSKVLYVQPRPQGPPRETSLGTRLLCHA